MHQLKVLILGPTSFYDTLNELKPFLKFNSITEKNSSDFDVILFHEDALNDKEESKIINNSNSLKVCASSNKPLNSYDAFLKIPSSLKEINFTVENVAAKKTFSRNSSIEIKKYSLNKNEKKLSKNENSIVLTEKEIQLLELFLKTKNLSQKIKFFHLFGITHQMPIPILLKHIFID